MPAAPRGARRPLAAGLPASRGAGLTMVELLVVLVIVAILFFAVQPAFLGVVRASEKRTALRNLVGLLGYARTAAVGGGRLVRVNCDPDRGVFWAEQQVDPQQDRSAFTLLRVLGRSKVRLPDAVSVTYLSIAGQPATQGTEQIYFYTDGRTDGAVLTLSDGSGSETVLQLSPATGKVTVSA